MKLKLVLFASILGLASAPAAQAFDFFTSTANVADTGTFWSNNLTLGAYNAYLATSPAVVHPMSDLLIANGGAGITITTLLSDTGTFGINHQDLTLSPAGFNVNYNFTGTNTLFFPDSFRAPDAAELNGAGVNNVKKYIAGGDTTVFEGVQWAFSNAITVLQTNIYLVPEANHGTFSGSDVLFTNVADSRSQIVAAPTATRNEPLVPCVRAGAPPLALSV